MIGYGSLLNSFEQNTYLWPFLNLEPLKSFHEHFLILWVSFQWYWWLLYHHYLSPAFSSWQVDDNALFKFFATRLTSCKSAKVVTEQGGGSKGFGFVRFTTDEDSKKAISNYNLSSGLGQNRIRVCKAFPKQ